MRILSIPAQWLWAHFRHSALWRFLRRIGFLRSGLYLAYTLQQTFLESRYTDCETVDRDFKLQLDPFRYATDAVERTRFALLQEALDRARGARVFQHALEIGCAEGVFTEVIADRCRRLLVLDISPTALDRARARRVWGDLTEFQEWDLLHDPLPCQFDLIVLTGVLEYFKRPATFLMVRTKMVNALKPGGYLLLGTTRANPVVESAWWGRRLVRGKWINAFIADHEALEAVETINRETFVITLFQRQ